MDDLSAHRGASAANPGDMDERYELAGGQMAKGDHEAAAATLLGMIAADDRDWNEGAARQRLLKLFEAVGLEDPWVADAAPQAFRRSCSDDSGPGRLTRLSVFPLGGALLFPAHASAAAHLRAALPGDGLRTRSCATGGSG